MRLYGDGAPREPGAFPVAIALMQRSRWRPHRAHGDRELVLRIVMFELRPGHVPGGQPVQKGAGSEQVSPGLERDVCGPEDIAEEPRCRGICKAPVVTPFLLILQLRFSGCFLSDGGKALSQRRAPR
jgi:hypothetical protein